MRKQQILKTIRTIRESFIGSEDVYMNGSCYHFHLILKNIYPEAIPYYNEDHVITLIDDTGYDILGEVDNIYNFEKLDVSVQSMASRSTYLSLREPFNIYKNK